MTAACSRFSIETRRINAESRWGVALAKWPAGATHPMSHTVCLNRHYATMGECLALRSPSQPNGARVGREKGFRGLELTLADGQ